MAHNIAITDEAGHVAVFTTGDKAIFDYMTRVLEHVALWNRDTEEFVLPVPSSGEVKWYTPLVDVAAAKATVTVPRETAEIVDRVFLPTNPNKCRHAEEKDAAHAFRNAVRGRRA